MAQQILDNSAIRLFLMDKPEYNTLLDSVRWKDEAISQAALMTVSAYNEMQPPSPVIFSVESFPYFYTLLTGTAGYLLKSAAINEASNNLTYVVDNMSIDDKNHAEIFLKMGGALWEEFKEMALGQKTSANLAACYGGVGSEWAYRAFNY